MKSMLLINDNIIFKIVSRVFAKHFNQTYLDDLYLPHDELTNQNISLCPPHTLKSNERLFTLTITPDS